MARPVLPSAPPVDEGYGGSLSSSSGSRGSIRPHSVSPFLRSVRQKLEEEGEEDIDIEAIAYLLDFSTRERGACTPNQTITSQTVSSLKVAGPSGSSESSVMVRTFAVSPPTTPAAAPRPERPPQIISSQLRHSCHSCPVVRPTALRRTAPPPAAALGAPPTQDTDDDETELPDIPETPASPAISDITVIRLVILKKIFLYILL